MPKMIVWWLRCQGNSQLVPWGIIHINPYHCSMWWLDVEIGDATPNYSISQEICTRFLLCCALLWLYIDWFSQIHQAYLLKFGNGWVSHFILHFIMDAVTVYPKKYAHGYCFAVLCCGYTLTDFPISIRLTSLALWQSNDCPSASKATLMNMDKYFMWIHYERLHNHNKAKHNKTVCIFLGIYCMWNSG